LCRYQTQITRPFKQTYQENAEMDRGGVIGREVRGHPEPQDVFGFDEDIDGKAHQTCGSHLQTIST